MQIEKKRLCDVCTKEIKKEIGNIAIDNGKEIKVWPDVCVSCSNTILEEIQNRTKVKHEVHA